MGRYLPVRRAQTARKKLKVTWTEPPARAAMTSASFAQQAEELSKKAPGRTLRKDGDADAALASAAKVVEGNYSYPFISHAPLEPQNCTANFKDGKIEMWSSSQIPGSGRNLAAAACGVTPNDVTLHMVRGGGGFGRRLTNDYCAEAAYISKLHGTPIKLLWSREDDMHHDYYRPGGYQYLKAGLDASGKVVAWRNHFITYGDGEGDKQRIVSAGAMGPTEFPQPFIANYALHTSVINLGIRTGSLRAPSSNAFGFVIQSFIDELAHAAGKDPVEFRRQILAETPKQQGYNAARMRGVLDLAAEKGVGLGQEDPPQGHGDGRYGFLYFSHQGYFAEVAEVTVTAQNKVRVNKVWVAADVGMQIINPTAADNMVQGAVIDGMSELMYQEITVDTGQGAAEQLSAAPVAAFGLGSQGHRDSLFEVREPAHRFGSTFASPHPARGSKCDLHRHREAHPFVAVQKLRLQLRVSEARSYYSSQGAHESPPLFLYFGSAAAPQIFGDIVTTICVYSARRNSPIAARLWST